MERENDVCDTVLSAVAEAEGVEPAELDQSLSEVVDPDALRALFAPKHDGTPREGAVTFTYCGYEVTVESPGGVRVSDPSGSASSAAGTA